MGKLEFVILALAVVQGLILVTASSIAEAEKIPQPRLISIGTIEGKTYFYDKTSRNWATAKTYCTGLGMRLATIKTAGQEAFLKSKYNATGFNGLYWIGGRDARTINQFAWDDDNYAIANVGQTMVFTSQLTCLMYRATTYGGWHSYSCSEGGGYVICETF